MGKLQLRALFLAGTTLGFSAQDIFTDRLSEFEAFERARQAVRGQSSVPFAELYRQARRNVLCYYGAGGIGKTALSKELERRFMTVPVAAHRTPATLRLDVSSPLERDPETLVLGIRGAVGRTRTRLTAFDLGLGAYWERAHPGYSLQDFLARHGMLAGVAAELSLAEHIQATIADALGLLGPIGGLFGAGSEGARWIVRRIRQARQERGLLSECPFFEQLVEADADDDTFVYLLSLLAWDLSVSPSSEREVVVFIDGFEELSQLSGRRVEQLIQRACYLLPNILFVITGRNRLDWAELSAPSELDYVGRSRWPLLHPENVEDEPRQHLLGYLSDHDCRDFLQAVFSEAHHRLPEPIEAAIVAGSGGLPLYLDLEVANYLEVIAAGREPTAQLFGGPLSAIVERTMRDMSPEERRLLRAAALLRAFQADLLDATAGDVSDSAVEQFLSRPFIERNGGTWPYSLHNTLRDTVREVDHEAPDGWSQREWLAAAERAMAHLGGSVVAGEEDRRLEHSSRAFATGMNLCRTYGLHPDWLVSASRLLADSGLWAQLDMAISAPDDSTEAGVAYTAGFRGVALRRRGRLSESLDEFNACLRSASLTSAAERYFRLHRANSLRNSGHYDDAQTEYEGLEVGTDEVAESAAYQLADIALLRGDFPECFSAAEAFGTDDPYTRTELLRLKGHATRFSGHFGEAEQIYRQALGGARNIGSLSAEGKALTNIAECRCWMSPADGKDDARAAVEFNRDIGNRLEVLKALVAYSVACVAVDPAEVDQALTEAFALAEDVGYVAGTLFCHWARSYEAAYSGDEHRLREIVETMISVADQMNVYRFIPAIAMLWLPEAAEDDSEMRPDLDPNWLQDPGRSVAAWRALPRMR